jgi:hypothetical protein
VSRVRRQGRRARDAANRAAVRTARALRLGHYVTLDYPPSSSPAPAERREGRLAELVAAGEPSYRAALERIASYGDELARIPHDAPDGRSPAWVNDFLPGLDGAAIYAYLRSREPRTYLEVGSGTSTRFARRAIEDGGLATRIVSIDPSPRAEVDAICDEVIRSPMELADAAPFEALEAGDVLFLDGSHRVFTGSDATVFFLDLLPALAPGVLVGVHDVYLPDDYPADIAERHYSEQYLLAALILGEPSWLRLELAADFVSKRPELASTLDPLWSRPELAGVQTHGVALWLETAAR